MLQSQSHTAFASIVLDAFMMLKNRCLARVRVDALCRTKCALQLFRPSNRYSAEYQRPFSGGWAHSPLQDLQAHDGNDRSEDNHAPSPENDASCSSEQVHFRELRDGSIFLWIHRCTKRNKTESWCTFGVHQIYPARAKCSPKAS